MPITPAFVYGAPRWHGSRLELPYRSRGEGGETVEFVEVVDFGEPVDVPVTSILVQLLHAAVGLSYYKARPADVELDFDADPRVAGFLRTLLANGLAEYAHVNRRRDALTPAIGTPRLRPAVEGGGQPGHGVDAPLLVPLGGGKDSVVSLSLLQQHGHDVRAFAVGEHPVIRHCAEAAGVDLTVVSRTLDPGLAVFTHRTGLNGHVPVTAINSLVALVYAAGAGFRDVVMSNEASADEATLEADGLVVNHQWSKSTAFEQLLQPLLPAGLGYFSLLRPLQEVAIARYFAELGTFDTVAISCNHVYLRDPARREPSWCLRCAKCAFVGLILAPFMSPERRVRMFGADVVASTAMSTHLAALCGVTGDKPLECVGEVLESRAALLELARSGESLPGFAQAVFRQLQERDLLPTDDQVKALFVVDEPARARLPRPYRHVLDEL